MSDDKLLEQLDAPQAEAWRPEDGEHVIGFVVRVNWRPAGEYDAYPIVTLRRDDGTEVAIHAFHFVLKNQLLERRPKVGERIAIKYHGRVEAQDSDRTYANYTVASESEPGSDADWHEPDPTHDSPSDGDDPTGQPPLPARDGSDIPF